MAHGSLVAPLVLAALVGACGQSKESAGADARAAGADSTESAAAGGGELRVSNIMIGKRVGAGNHITDPSFQFTPRDTVYISVGTTGSAGSGTLTAAWRYQTGEIVQQSSEPLPQPAENAVFKLSPAKGLKPGTYKVIVLLGDDSVDTKVFVVKKQ